ncbi:MAG TPA: glycosyltransferase family 8 protein [Candidatus Limosilactobacillus excrementigallinarum]|nr:glycosyltransferase family 8 protein [Candidatus Limosilactobacillus excrementigallinarum]
MNLLFSIDDRFYQQLLTVLYSIDLNSSANDINVYVIVTKDFSHSAELSAGCHKLGMHYHQVEIPESAFQNAPVTDRYPTTIYYRLLAHLYLPKQLHRILYLDADLLCINDLRPLYDIDLKNYMYASAIHTNLTNATDVINKIRLQNFDADGYYNSGVLLMNLDEIRRRVDPNTIFDYIRDHILLLPDQDVLNALYGRYILSVPDELYNFDARNLRVYETITLGKCTLDWVIKNTVILHYCGRQKPWLATTNHGRFTSLYKNYFQMTSRLMQD